MVESVSKTKIDTSGDGIISQEEWDQWAANVDPTKKGEEWKITDDKGNKIYQGKLTDLQNGALKAEFAKSGDAKSPDAPLGDLDTVTNQMETLKKDIEQAAKLSQDEIVKHKQQQLKDVISQVNADIKKNGEKSAFKNMDLGAYKEAAGEQHVMSGKAQVAMNQSGTQGGGGGAAAQTAGAQGMAGKAFYPPAGWSAAAQTLGGSPGFTTDTYMKTMTMEDSMMSSWDDINKNTNRGKQLMMLFFYFARMAESGDMGAMYQFMKFITFIISKDKAKQQIEMGKKLIALQELSRSWTNKLLNVQTNSADPNSSNELMKTMTIVKSETDAIATSQKLISQMMEEFAQVVEALTNTTKGALETAGRISRSVSTLR
ncbi:MAG: hypothetical protein WC956_06180 [bacterium]